MLGFDDGSSQSFDHVVFACHAPQALQLLNDASAEERSVLGAFRTTPNATVLHTDSRLLPRSEHARASWNYHLGTEKTAPTLTYHMNRLQNITTREDYCVTLNATDRIEPKAILQRTAVFTSPLHA